MINAKYNFLLDLHKLYPPWEQLQSAAWFVAVVLSLHHPQPRHVTLERLNVVLSFHIQSTLINTAQLSLSQRDSPKPTERAKRSTQILQRWAHHERHPSEVTFCPAKWWNQHFAKYTYLKLCTPLLLSLIRFLATPFPALPQPSDQRFLHFVHFLLCGKPALTQGQILQVGKLKSFFLRRYTIGRINTSDTGSVPHSLTVQFSPSTPLTLSLFVGDTWPLLGMNETYRENNLFGEKMPSNLFS